MLKYVLLVFIVTNAFSMISLSEKQADKTIKLLKDKKAALMYNNGNYKYIKIMTITKIKGRISSSSKFDIIHNEDNFYIKINGINADFSKLYIPLTTKNYEWILLGNKIDSKLFINNLFNTIYVHRKNSKSELTKKNFLKIGTVELFHSVNGGGMTPTINQLDAQFNKADVFVINLNE